MRYGVLFLCTVCAVVLFENRIVFVVGADTKDFGNAVLILDGKVIDNGQDIIFYGDRDSLPNPVVVAWKFQGLDKKAEAVWRKKIKTWIIIRQRAIGPAIPIAVSKNKMSTKLHFNELGGRTYTIRIEIKFTTGEEYRSTAVSSPVKAKNFEHAVLILDGKDIPNKDEAHIISYKLPNPVAVGWKFQGLDKKAEEEWTKKVDSWTILSGFEGVTINKKRVLKHKRRSELKFSRTGEEVWHEISIKIEFNTGVEYRSTVVRSEAEAPPEGRDCVWSNWSDWTPCARTCGYGIQTRTRSHEIEATYGGRECIGYPQQSRLCGGQPSCPIRSYKRCWCREI